MDLSFSPEQEMLRSQARAFLQQHLPPERVAQMASAQEGWDPSSWQQLTALGWTGASVPEEHGGAGMGFLEEAVLFEELGRALYPGPYLATVGLALPALRGSPALMRRVASGALTATLAWLEPGREVSLAAPGRVVAEGCRVDGHWRLRGRKHLVPDAGIVGAFVVVASGPDGLALFLVERGDGRPHVTVPETVDETRRLGRLELDGEEAALLAAGDDALAIVAAIRSRALAALALEAVGVATHVLGLAVAHAKVRQQFGRPIGVYQAVSHGLADSYVETELARSLAYWAAWCVAEGSADAALAATAAKSYAAEAAVGACERAIQVHGGMGFTWEHILHRYYKRALWISSFEGSGTDHRAEVAAALFDG